MFIFRLLNIMVGKKEEVIMTKQGARCKKRMLHKRLFFISKGLQLIQRITVNGVVPHTLETSGANSSLLFRKKNPQGKRREKR